MKSLHSAPFLKISVAFLLGIWVCCLSDCRWAVLAICLIGGVGTILYCWKNGGVNSYNLILTLGILGCWGALGFVRTHIEISASTRMEVNSLERHNCQEVVLLCSVSTAPRKSPLGSRVLVEAHSILHDGKWMPLTGGLMVYGQPKDSLLPDLGDTLCLRGGLTTFYSTYPTYLKLMQEKGIGHALHVRDWVRMGKNTSLQAYAYRLQQQASIGLTRAIDNEEVEGLAQAMFLGEKRQLPNAQREAFARAGASHVLAISGLHVGLVFVLLNGALSLLVHIPSGRQIRALSVLVLLLGYMLLTGAAPAVVRATLMLGTVLIFRLFRARFHPLNIIGLAGFLQMIWEPTIILEIGFQLSYAAVIGIVSAMPQFQKYFTSQSRGISKVYGWLGVSIIASLATAPLVLYHFGQFPTYFLLTNLLISLFVSALVMLGFLTVLFSWVPLIGEGLGGLCATLLQLLNFICNQISQLPHAVLERDSDWLSGGLILGLQILLALIFLSAPRWIKGLKQRTRPQNAPVFS